MFTSMKNYWLILCPAIMLIGCTHFDENRANQFQSLSQDQQAQYWQMKNVLRLIDQAKAQGFGVYVQGDEYQIIIPANRLFKGSTPQTLGSMNATLRPVVDLINAQSTPAVHVLAYTDSSTSKDRNFALTQSWAQTVLSRLREEDVITGLLSAEGHGECDNIGGAEWFNNRIEIRYRISHDH